MTESGTPSAMPGRTNGSFTSHYCKKVIRLGAVACAALILLAIAGFKIQPEQCVGWHGIEKNGEPTTNQLYVATVIAGIAALWICFIAVRWEWFAQKAITKIRQAQADATSATNQFDRFSGECGTQINFDSLFVVVTLSWVGFCSFPLILMIVKC